MNQPGNTAQTSLRRIRRRVMRRLASAGALALGVVSFAGSASAQESPTQVVTAAISVAPSSVTPPATATATATFEVGEIANVVGGRVVTLSLNLLGSDGSLQLDEASITTSAGLTGCAPASAAPVLSYSCEVVGPTATTDTYSISATILSQTPNSGFPVVAEVSANSSYRDGTNQSIDSAVDVARLAVLLPGVEPPAGTTVSATCLADLVTVVIGAFNETAENYVINVGDDVDLLADAVATGSHQFPAGGASDIKVRVFQLPDLDLIFDQTVVCAAAPTTTTTTTTTTNPTTTTSTTTTTTPVSTTVAPTTTSIAGGSPDLPSTGGRATGLAVVALALCAVGGLALAASRRHRHDLG